MAGVERHWRGGRYLEDFTVGEIIRHRLTRSVTQMDNMLFSNMTLNRSRSTSTPISARRRRNGAVRSSIRSSRSA